MRPNPEVMDTVQFRQIRHRRTQKPPYVAPLPYSASISGRKTRNTYNGKTTADVYLPTMTDKILVDLRNLCVARARSELGSVALILEDLAQAKSLVRTVEQRLVTTLRFAKRLPKITARNIAVLAGVTRRDSARDVRELSSVPKAWLEFNFAIMPTIGTVTNLVQHMSQAEFSRKVKFGATIDMFHIVSESKYSDYWYSNGTRSSHWCGYVFIRNPNASLAQTSGLASPFETAWALVPWSWAIDYFVDVSAFAANADKRFAGFQYRNWCESTKTVTFCTANGIKLDGSGIGSDSFYHRSFSRALRGGPPLSHTLRVNPDLNLRRVSYLASAIALTLKKKLS